MRTMVDVLPASYKLELQSAVQYAGEVLCVVMYTCSIQHSTVLRGKGNTQRSTRYGSYSDLCNGTKLTRRTASWCLSKSGTGSQSLQAISLGAIIGFRCERYHPTSSAPLTELEASRHGHRPRAGHPTHGVALAVAPPPPGNSPGGRPGTALSICRCRRQVARCLGRLGLWSQLVGEEARMGGAEALGMPWA